VRVRVVAPYALRPYEIGNEADPVIWGGDLSISRIASHLTITPVLQSKPNSVLNRRRCTTPYLLHCQTPIYSSWRHEFYR
jgi:hypothetical protein